MKVTVGWTWRVGSSGHQEAATLGQVGNGAREAAGQSTKADVTSTPWHQKSLASCQTNWQKFFYKKASGIQWQPCELGPLGILNGLTLGGSLVEILEASTRSKCGFMSGKPKDSIFKAEHLPTFPRWNFSASRILRCRCRMPLKAGLVLWEADLRWPSSRRRKSALAGDHITRSYFFLDGIIFTPFLKKIYVLMAKRKILL